MNSQDLIERLKALPREDYDKLESYVNSLLVKKGMIPMTNDRMNHDIRCPYCKKLIAKKHDGKVYVWCKLCRQEVLLNTEHDHNQNSRKEM